jgi:hypothetical protein
VAVKIPFVIRANIIRNIVFGVIGSGLRRISARKILYTTVR